MTKYVFSVLLLLFFCEAIKAQQLPIFTQYRQYQSYINPASFSAEFLTDQYNLGMGLSMRSQWVGVDGTPKTGLLYGEHIYDPRNGNFGIVSGINLVYDYVDPFALTGIYGRVGTLLSSDLDYGALSIGITAGVVQYRFNATKLQNDIQNEAAALDPLIQEDYAKLFPDVGVGIFYMKEIYGGGFSGDIFYAGLSVPQVFGLNYKFEYKDGQNSEQFGIDRIPHFFLTAGYYKYFEQDSYIELSSFVKTVDKRRNVHVDFNVRGVLNDLFWIGAGASTVGNFHLEAGFIVGENFNLDNAIKIGYGLDIPFTDYGPQFGSSHEINISYAFEY